MTAETVLIVEDDEAMRRVLKDNFQVSGFQVETAEDGEVALAKIGPGIDLVVLDIMLPRVDGFEVCRRIRSQGSDAFIIMLTAKGEESDAVLGLNLGADDYVTKPFRVRELLARAQAFMRRRKQASQESFAFAHFKLDQAAHRLCHPDGEVELTPKEFGLLEFFLRNRGRAVTREQILNSVWGSSVHVTFRSVDRCVNTLRSKIEEDPSRPRFIRTIREVGYRFEESSSTVESRQNRR
ncbi:MAG TPA: response regulator transcription factor [Acidobacteriota bacterium]|nr:response regulator transcription factor [Acidobacteriota bacterium]